MKIRITHSLLFISSLLLFSHCGYSQAGTLDNSFDIDGKVTTSIGNTYDVANAVAVQTDGKIIVAGASSNASNVEFAVVRYNSNGSLDNSFDMDGKLTTAIGSSGCQAYAIAIQPDGKILVAGETLNGTNKDFAIVRYNTDGSLDLSFDTDGIVTTPIGVSSELASAIAIQTDGKIVVGGYTTNGTQIDFALTRYNTNGSLDISFDTDGIVTTQIDTFSDAINSIAIQSDGKIVVGGYTSNGSNNDFALARYNTNGSLDNTFDNDGVLKTSFGNSYEGVYSIALQTDGKIIAAGASFIGLNYDFAIARYHMDGTLDTNFDLDGKVTAPIGNGNDRIYAMKLQQDGKIVATGMTENGANDNIAVARFNTNGSLDLMFDLDGKVTTAVGNSDDVASAITLQSDGKIIVAGYSNNGANNDIAVCRYLNSIATELNSIENMKNEISIFPNPTTSFVTINFNSKVLNGFCAIFNSTGSIVHTINILNGTTIELDFSQFSPGVYLVQLTQNGSEMSSGKLIVK